MHISLEKTIFFIGNKRSGTSLLTHILNFHPDVYISYESDIIWILYQLWLQKDLEMYPLDGEKGLRFTLRKCNDLLIPGKYDFPALRETFFKVLMRLMREGGFGQPKYRWKRPVVWGDKKPIQSADPEVFEFILELFPESTFIRIIRNPVHVIQSMRGYRQHLPRKRQNLKDLDTVIKDYLTTENRVQELESRHPNRFIHLRYEELCSHPKTTLQKLFTDLQIDNSLYTKLRAKFLVKEPVGHTPFTSLAINEIAARYGY